MLLLSLPQKRYPFDRYIKLTLQCPHKGTGTLASCSKHAAPRSTPRDYPPHRDTPIKRPDTSPEQKVAVIASKAREAVTKQELTARNKQINTGPDEDQFATTQPLETQLLQDTRVDEKLDIKETPSPRTQSATLRKSGEDHNRTSKTIHDPTSAAPSKTVSSHGTPPGLVHTVPRVPPPETDPLLASTAARSAETRRRRYIRESLHLHRRSHDFEARTAAKAASSSHSPSSKWSSPTGKKGKRGKGVKKRLKGSVNYELANGK
eukprot:sb/3468390/